MAVQDYELLLRVRADLLEAISGLKGLTTELGQGDAAAKQLGSTADTTAAKVDALAQSLKARDDANARSFDATARAAQQSKQVIADMDAEAAAHKRASSAAQAYRDAESARGTANAATVERTAALAAQRTEMAKLAGQIDPTIGAMARLDAQERSLNAMRKAGVVGMEDYTRFKAVIDANRVSIGGAAKSMHTFSLNTQQTRLEMGRLIKDISTGQWGRLASTGTTLANQAGFISLLFSPLGLAIGAVTGSLGAFAVAAEQAAQDTNKFNQAIQQTGNYAGVTSGGLEKMASGITSASGSLGDSRKVLTTLVATGKIGAQSLQSLGQAAVDMAQLTGVSADKAAGAVLKMFDGTAASALKADEQYHFLTTSIYDQIKAFEESGDTQAAIDTAAQAFHEAAQARIEAETAQLRGLAKVWDGVKKSAAGAWEATKTAASLITGSADDQTQLYELLGKKQTAKEGGLNATGRALSTVYNPDNLIGGSLGTAIYSGLVQKWTPEDEANLKALQDKIAKAEDVASDQGTKNDLNSAANQADAGLDRLAQSIDKAYAKKEKIKELNKYFDDLWAGADPGNAKLNGVQRFVNADGTTSYGGGLYDTLMADIEKAPKLAKARAPKKENDTAALAAQQQLIKLLGDEQGALDPLAKAWATYNDEVNKVNALAAKAVTAKGADVVAINAQRDALVKLYATQREAAIAAQAQKTQEMIDKAIKPLPTYKGLDGAVGGPFGEVAKADQAQQALDEAYAKDLEKLNEFHTKKLLADEQFVQRENALFQQHADETGRIEQARNQAMLMGITQSFASAAEAIKQGFGAQSGAYRAAFALSKAAAIAQATVNMYMDISQASAKGWPQNIPLIAMAAGEGLSIIGALSGLSAGFREGGYTGPGAIDQPAGTVHAGEVVWSQKDIARAGGVSMVEAMRLGMIGYADGGVVGAFASAADFPRGPTPGMPRNTVEKTAAPTNNMRVYVVQNEDQLLQRLSQHPAMEKAVVAIAGENGTAIRAKW